MRHYLIILAISLAFGFAWLESYPVHVHGDEGWVGVHARELAYQGGFNLYSSRWHEFPQFMFWPPALTLRVFGDDLFGLRASAVIIGALTVLLVFSFVWSASNLTTAYLSALLLLTMPFFAFLMRSGMQNVQASFFCAAIIWLLRQCRETKSLKWLTLAGVALAFGLMSYSASQILPFLWIASHLILWAQAKIDVRYMGKALLLPLLVMLAIFSPLYFLGKYSPRAKDASIFSEKYWRHMDQVYKAEGNSYTVIYEQSRRAMLAPFVWPDSSEQYKAKTPMLNPVLSILVIAGIGISLWHRFYIAPLWLISILFIGGALMVDAPSYPRLAGVPPVLVILASVPIGHLIEWAKRAHASAARWIWGVVGAAFLAALALNLNNTVQYMVRDSPTTLHMRLTEIAWRIAEIEGPVYVLSESSVIFDSGTVKFLAPHAIGGDIRSWDDATPPCTVLWVENREIMEKTLDAEAMADEHPPEALSPQNITREEHPAEDVDLSEPIAEKEFGAAEP